MPSRIHSYFPERKITNPNPPANAKPGSAPAVNEKTANWAKLPGKASHWYKVSGTKVKIHPSSQGL